MSIKRLISFLAAIGLLTGCVSYYKVDSHVRICNDAPPSDGSIIQTKTDEGGASQTTTFRFIPEINDGDKPIAQNALWVMVTGFSVGRRNFSRGKWYGGTEPVPMWYSTENAYVEIEGRGKIKADPHIYLAKESNHFIPGFALPESMVDLNSDVIQISPKPGMRIYGSIFIKFRTPPLSAGESGLLHFGDIKLGNKLYNIPDFRFCTVTGSSQWMYSHFRP